MWCLGILLIGLLQNVSSIKVQTRFGSVEGAKRQFHGLHKNGSYSSFEGIPYALPPIGERRFKDPVSWEDEWEEDLDVSGGPPNICPQPKFFNPGAEGEIDGNEDCLFLNIYSEELPNSGLNKMELKPVMFWIHGGGFMIGSGAQLGEGSGSDYLLESGMVVVTINYRLGALGFLALDGTNIQGNQGLKDQLMALRWVKQNIANFGGDPSRITISGESAGGMSVHAHVLSPVGKDEDLFHRAISFSGTLLIGGDFSQTIPHSKKLFQKLCETKDDAIPTSLDSSCLYDLKAKDLVNEASEALSLSKLTIREQVQKAKEEDVHMYQFYPVIDYWADQPFLPSHPITILHNQEQKMVPYMTGLNKDEGGMLVAPHWKNMKPGDNQLAENWGYIGAQQVLTFSPKEITFEKELSSRMIAQFYVGKDGVNRENKQGLSDLFTDAFFAYPNTETVKLHSLSSAPIYNYLMSYRGSASFAPLFAGGDEEAAKQDFGVTHGDDLMYLFRVSFGNMSTINTENDEKFVEIWQKLIVNFAKYGNPTPVQLENIPKWPKAQNSRAACVYLDIGLEPQEKHRMFAERMEFWNKLFFADLLEKYAISEQENELLAAIDIVIDESEDESIEEEEEEEDNSIRKNKGRPGKQKRKGNWRKNMKQKRIRKQRRLAKKLKQLNCN